MKKIVYGLLAFSPVLAFAQDADTTVANLEGIVQLLTNLFNNIIPLLIAVAVVYFFWGLITFLRASGDPKAIEAGRSQMIWGVIAIAVMVSLFGLINFLQNTLGVDSGTITPPRV